ncbi:MAG TPA: carboxylating nicotinate-nucleotide diphosphorylase, partial [bacterium]|nr:carboxylating nicotinate-nucleotide diphosphorylase [bacterium]
AKARLWSREVGLAAGLPIFARVFRKLDPRVAVKARVAEGAPFRRGQLLAELSGPARAILSGERAALNILQRLCGIAALTAAYVAEARKGSRTVKLLDTRKTTPGLRLLEKYAVACGGGTNHRLRLDDAVLIKDNHLKVAGSVAEAVRRARGGGLAVEVEVETLAELDQALAAGADTVLLDNFPLASLRAAQARVDAHNRGRGRKVLTEASGGVTLKTLRAVAATGVDHISVGALTHSARALDLSLEFLPL